MAKYKTLMSIKREGKRIPAGTVFADFTRDEIAELKERRAIAFVPPTEAEEQEAAAATAAAAAKGSGAQQSGKATGSAA